MPKYLKIITGIALVLVAVFILQSRGRDANQPSNVLKIGAILPLTGDLAYVGQEMQRGMELALQEANDSNIKVIYEDDLTFDIKSSVNAANKLANVNQVDIVFNSVVDTIKALAPILSQKQIPGIVIWDSNKTINGLGEYVYGMGLSTEHAGSDMAELAYKNLGLRHISVISNFNEWSEIISQSFIEKFKALGGAIDFHEKVEIDSKDLRVNLVKILNKKSEGIYFPTYNPSLQSLIRQSRELGFKGYLFTGDTLSDADINTLGQNTEGVYSTQAYLENPEFLRKYKQKYGQETPAINLAFAGMGYDAVNFILAIKQDLQSKNLPITSQNIQSRIVGFEFNGVTGKTVFSPERITDKRETILKVQNGILVKP